MKQEIYRDPFGFDEWDRWWQADPTVRAEILGRALGGPVNGAPAALVKPKRPSKRPAAKA